MKRKTVFRFLFLSAALLFGAISFSGCLKSTYPKDYVIESVLKILKNEYNVPHAQVVITGKTIHMYLPVDRLFTADLDDVKVSYITILGAQVRNGFVLGLARIISFPQDAYWELLARAYHFPFLRRFKLDWVHTKFEKKKIEKIQDAISLHPDVQDGIGQMLFAVARVARSTDLELDFYAAQITDTRSGHEFTLQGYLPDMNRLQLLDISQSEYHKRMLKDTRVNQRALVHYPVRQFFQDLNQKTREEVQQKYFAKLSSQDWLERFYYKGESYQLYPVSQMTWEPEQVSSFLSPAGGRALVYVNVVALPRAEGNGGKTEPKEEKFIFETMMQGKVVQILRIIPYHLLSEMLASVPEFNLTEKSLEENIKTWHSEFEPKEIFLEGFLARQIMSRLYEVIYQDERIAHTFNDLGFEVRFRDTPAREFVFDIRVVLKDEQALLSRNPLNEHEDVIYLNELFLRTASTVIYKYRYKDFSALALEMPSEGERMVALPQDLEDFYQKKKKLSDILKSDLTSVSAFL